MERGLAVLSGKVLTELRNRYEPEDYKKKVLLEGLPSRTSGQLSRQTED
jgi:hypothetical protein